MKPTPVARERHEPEPDPTTRLVRRLGVVFLVGGFFVFTVPRVVGAIADGNGQERVGAVVFLGFWAWLAWRLAILARGGHAAATPGYWRLTAVGYVVILLAGVMLEVVDALDGTVDTRSLPFLGLVLFFAVGTGLAARGRPD